MVIVYELLICISAAANSEPDVFVRDKIVTAQIYLVMKLDDISFGRKSWSPGLGSVPMMVAG